MKRSLMLSVATSVVVMAGGTVVPKVLDVETPKVIKNTGGFAEALQNGTFSVDAKLMYFNRDWDNDEKNDPSALTIGGIMKYESKPYLGMKVGFAYYTSHNAGIIDRDESFGSSMLDAEDGGSIDILGEAYLDFAYANSSLRVGRQKMSVPNITQRNIRLLPVTHEAIVFKNSDIKDTRIELGYVKSYTSLGARANSFNEIDDGVGSNGDNGVSYLHIENKSIPNTTIKAEYLLSNSDEDKNGEKINHENSTWMEISYNLVGIGNNTFVKVHGGSSSYALEDDAMYYGGKFGTTISGIDVEVLYDKVVDNKLFFGFSPPPLYSDWYIGYDNYEASTAFGGAITFYPFASMDCMIGAVDIRADEGNTDDDYLEINAVVNYKISDNSSFQFRYENRDQSDKSGKDDMQDIVLSYSYSF